MKKHTILVCGGAGYIGSHMVRMLKVRGYTPVVVDNLSTGHPGAVDKVLVGDVLDEPWLDYLFSHYKFDAVMHFCAKSCVGESFDLEEEYFHNNVGGLRCILRAMKKHSVSTIIFSSSAAVYAEGPEVLTEYSPLGPINPYGKTKVACEDLLIEAAKSGIDSMSLRYFNAAGACPMGGIGEKHDPETHLIPLAINAALNGGPEIEVYGGDYDTPDGTCIRDYVHVNDICVAHLLSLASLQKKPGARQVNIGCGRGYSVLEVLKAVEKAVGAPVPYKMADRRPGDPAWLTASNTLASVMLGWEPSYLSTLRRITETAVAWHRNPEFIRHT